MHRMMVYLFAFTNIGPRSPPGYQRWVVVLVEVVVPAGNPHRWRREVNTVMPHLEWLSEGINDVG